MKILNATLSLLLLLAAPLAFAQAQIDSGGIHGDFVLAEVTIPRCYFEAMQNPYLSQATSSFYLVADSGNTDPAVKAEIISSQNANVHQYVFTDNKIYHDVKFTIQFQSNFLFTIPTNLPNTSPVSADGNITTVPSQCWPTATVNGKTIYSALHFNETDKVAAMAFGIF